MTKDYFQHELVAVETEKVKQDTWIWFFCTYPNQYKGQVYLQLKKDCSIGGNATIMPNVVVREYAIIGVGAIVTKNVSANSTETKTNEIRNNR